MIDRVAGGRGRGGGREMIDRVAGGRGRGGGGGRKR